MFNSRQILILSLFCGVYVAWGLTDSIQAPFYPIEASSKGATPSEYGLVFGVIHLAIFVSGPFFGKFMHTFGVRNVYFFGVLLTSICAVSFGFLGINVNLEYVLDKNTFLGLSYGLRIMEGIAEAASWSAVFAMLMHMFPKNVAFIYAMTEASFSFAEMIGPTVGALLYAAGGFALPFQICGGLCFFTALLTLAVLPGETKEDKVQLLPRRRNSLSSSSSTNGNNSKKMKKFSFMMKQDDENSLPADSILMGNFGSESTLYPSLPVPSAPPLPAKRNDVSWDASTYQGFQADLPRPKARTFSVSSAASVVSEKRKRNGTVSMDQTESRGAEILPILGNAKVILALAGTVYGAACQGFLEATLEPFLSDEFKLSVTNIGLTFLGLSIPYFFASTSWGYLCDTWFSPVYIQPIGSVFTILGLLLVGPSSYVPELDWIQLPNHYVSIGGLSLMGIGTAALLVASFTGAQKAALENQNVSPDDAYSVISGIWTSSFALGNFIGPSLGGFLVDAIGFRKATVVFQLIGVFMLVLDVVTLTCFPPRTLGTAYHLKRVDQNTVKVDLYERLP